MWKDVYAPKKRLTNEDKLAIIRYTGSDNEEDDDHHNNFAMNNCFIKYSALDDN